MPWKARRHVVSWRAGHKCHPVQFIEHGVVGIRGDEVVVDGISSDPIPPGGEGGGPARDGVHGVIHKVSHLAHGIVGLLARESGRRREGDEGSPHPAEILDGLFIGIIDEVYKFADSLHVRL